MERKEKERKIERKKERGTERKERERTRKKGRDMRRRKRRGGCRAEGNEWATAIEMCVDAGGVRIPFAIGTK